MNWDQNPGKEAANEQSTLRASLAHGARDFLQEQEEDQCGLKGEGGEVAADGA